ncbi:hypothetical protein [Paenibacillus paridis]|uniref:hypothetical protein n=1 Tax=Paenibacillus paridis TaxID=2583376 RepID=UPI0011228747|nr:hypothetical protein [Paenibacillus paridis]
MIGFNTILPLSTTTTIDEFLHCCKTWVQKSPFTTLNIDDAEVFDGQIYNSPSESLEFVNHMNATGYTHCGVRHIKKDDDCEWRTDVIGYKTKDSFNVSVVTSKADFSVTTYSKLPLKPYIIKLLMESTQPMYDAQIPIEQRAKKVTSNNYSQLAALMKDEMENTFPVVYISQLSNGNYIVKPDTLAKLLSGFAHVYYQGDSKVPLILREQTNGLNTYNGTIGIYWPGGARNQYNDHFDGDHLTKLRIFLQKKLSNKTLLKEHKWSFIQELKYNEKINLYRNKDSDNNELIELFNAEIEKLQSTIKNLESENIYLNSQVDLLSSSEFSNSKPLLYKGSERELFENEQFELIKSLLKTKSEAANCSVRTKNIISSILSANGQSDNKENFLNTIKSILLSENGLKGQQKRELTRLGFDIHEDGKHYKLVFKADSQYSFTIPKSHSDHRGKQNNFRQFKDYFLSG